MTLKTNIRNAMTHFLHARYATCLIGQVLLIQFATYGIQADLSNASTDKVTQLINDLGDPSYDARSAATLALCEIGMSASDALRSVANGDDMEVAFRAKHVLELLDQILFAGVEIDLSLSKSSATWSESVDLIITLRNQSPYLARIPFDFDNDKSLPSTDARQVGLLLDIADWLTVTSASGSQNSLQVDDYTGNAAITKAIDLRLENAPSSVLPPHQTKVIRIRAINRGWARYRMLEQGSCTFKLAYLPAWNDKQLLDRRVGYAQSNEASLSIQSNAPSTISREGIEASVAVSISKEQNGKAVFKAHITNRHDRTMFVNTNLSGTGPPFARGQWIVTTGDQSVRIPSETIKHNNALVESEDVFSSNVIAVSPGESIEIGTISYDDLQRSLSEADGASLAKSSKLHFVYTNLWSQHWIKQKLATLPADTRLGKQWSAYLSDSRIISGRFDSTAIDLPKEK